MSLINKTFIGVQSICKVYVIDVVTGVLSVKARPLTETRDMGQQRRAERARRRWSYGGESQSLTHTPTVMAGTCEH